MTVAVASTETVYALMGTTLGAFSTVWPYNAASDVTCQVDYGAGGGPELLVQGADYTLTASNPTLSNGGSVVLAAHVLANFGAAWGTGAVVILARGTPRTQPSSYGEQVGFSPKSSEQALDNVSRQVQELTTQASRSVLAPYGEGGVTLPPAAERAGMLAMWDSTAPAPFIPLSPAEASELFKGDPGGNVMAVGLFSVVPVLNVPMGSDLIQTSGYAVTGVGAARYALDSDQVTAIASPTRVQTNNGRWFKLAESMVTPLHVGALGPLAAAHGQDDTAAVQLCFNYTAAICQPTYLYGGPYTCTADLLAPVAAIGPQTGAMVIQGPGWDTPAIIFSGAGVTFGLHSVGPVNNYAYGNDIRDLNIQCVNGALRGIYDEWMSRPTRRNIRVWGAVLQGVYVSHCNIPIWWAPEVLGCAGNNGAGGYGQVEFDNQCTVIGWHHGYISGGGVGCSAGLRVDRCNLGTFSGAIESCGVLVQIASKADNLIGCSNLTLNMDLENPSVPGSPALGCWYVEAGYGLTGGRTVKNLSIGGVMSPSGATVIPCGIKLANCLAPLIRKDISSLGLSPANAITSATYDPPSGTITVTMQANIPASLVVGGSAALAGLAGTGAFAQLAGLWTVLAGTAVRTVVLQGPVGPGAAALTGGSLFVGAAPANPAIALTSAAYVSSSGVITVTLPAAPPAALVIGAPVSLTALAGTGAFASLQGVWNVLYGTTGATVVLQGPVAAGAATVTGGSLYIVGAPTVASIWAEGAGNTGMTIEGAYSVYNALTYAPPWLAMGGTWPAGAPAPTVAGLQQAAASPLMRWEQWAPASISGKTGNSSGAWPTALVTAQGGINGTVTLSNAAGAVNAGHLIGATGNFGAEVDVVTTDANCTLTANAGGADQFVMAGNVTLVPSRLYRFKAGGTAVAGYWRPVTMITPAATRRRPRGGGKGGGKGGGGKGGKGGRGKGERAPKRKREAERKRAA
jgi:hypothetical protein